MGKNIPSIRFKGFHEAWEQCKLGEVAKIVRGASPRPIQDPKWFDKQSDVGWLRISDVTEQAGRIYHLEQHISELGQEKTRVLTEPHLLLSIAATVGKPVINYVKTGVHDGFLIFLRPKFDREFMFQWLEMFRTMWQKYGQPGSQVNLNSDLVKNQEVFLPSYREQEKIGAFFTNLDNLITLHQRKCDKLIIFKKSMLEKMFPKNGEKTPEVRFEGFHDAWEQCKLSSITDRFDNLRIPVTESNRIAGTTPYYGANGILGYIDGFTHDGEYVLIAEDGANDLNDYPVHYVNGKVWVNNHAHVIQGKEGMSDNRFLQYLFKTFRIDPYLVGGSRVKLNANIMMDLIISNPEIDEQIKIGAFFTNLDNLITLHQRKVEKLQIVKKFMLKKMFV